MNLRMRGSPYRVKNLDINTVNIWDRWGEAVPTNLLCCSAGRAGGAGNSVDAITQRAQASSQTGGWERWALVSHATSVSHIPYVKRLFAPALQLIWWWWQEYSQDLGAPHGYTVWVIHLEVRMIRSITLSVLFSQDLAVNMKISFNND